MTAYLTKPITRALLAIALGLVVMAFIAYRFLLLPQSNPPPVSPPYINITRSQYEQALAKWRAQNIREYEIRTYTRAFMDGVITLHVSDFGDKVSQLDPAVRPFDTLTQDEVEPLKRKTIEGMFAEIDMALQEGALNVTDINYTTYQVTFEPELGYPSYLEILPHNYYDGDRRITVTKLEIIEYCKQIAKLD